MFFADSHCHLNYPDYSETERIDIVKRAEQLGIQRFLTVSTKMDDVPELIEMTRQNPHIFASVGVHPEYAAEQGEGVSVEQLCKAAQDAKVVAIGEAGLDYHYGAAETRAAQKSLFRKHLQAAKLTGLPIIVHTREAEDDTIDLLREEQDGTLRGVLHCFSSQGRLAEFGSDIGFYISASGIITFKSAQSLRDTFEKIPMDRLLVETDAPYLAPVPFRGRKNEPSYLIKTAEMLAQIKGTDLDFLRQKTTENFFRLFSKAY